MKNVDIFMTFAALCAAIPVITKYLIDFIEHIIKKPTISQVKRNASHLVAVIVTAVGWSFKFGIFIDVGIWGALGICAGSILVSNKIYDLGVVTWILGHYKILK